MGFGELGFIGFTNLKGNKQLYLVHYRPVKVPVEPLRAHTEPLINIGGIINSTIRAPGTSVTPVVAVVVRGTRGTCVVRGHLQSIVTIT